MVFLFLLFFLIAYPVKAVCPLCTIAIASGVGLSRYLGIDDLISGIWIGGLIASLILSINNWIRNKPFKFKNLDVLSTIIISFLTIFILYQQQLIGIPENTLLGVDKLLLGIIIGVLILFFSYFFDNFLRFLNNNKVYFYYQKIIIPLVFLSLISIIFYVILKLI